MNPRLYHGNKRHVNKKFVWILPKTNTNKTDFQVLPKLQVTERNKLTFSVKSFRLFPLTRNLRFSP